MDETILKGLLQEGNTPAYLFDLSILRQKILRLKERIGTAELCFAMKANPFLTGSMNNLTDKFEVCSPGEFLICRKEGILPEKIVLSGVNKQREEVEEALDYGVVTFTAESQNQLSLLQECAKKAEKKIQVLLRLTSGNQFGMDEAAIRDIYERREEFTALHIAGLHYYSGTQKKEAKLVGEMEKLLAFCNAIEKDFGAQIEKLEYGPGLGISYFSEEDQEEEQIAVCEELVRLVPTTMQLTLEFGRFLTADCGSYITKVADVKCNDGQTYCILDGGIHHVNYYGQVMGVRVPPVRYYRKQGEGYEEAAFSTEKKKDGICICGSLCTIADVLVRSLPLDKVNCGDVFVFEKTGAYSVTEGINLFLSRKLPQVFLCDGNKVQRLRSAIETYPLNCTEK